MQCTHLIRGKKRCEREAVEGGTCSVHSEAEMQRQQRIRDDRRARLVEEGVARKAVDLAELAGKLGRAAEHLTPVTPAVAADPDAAASFESLYASSTTWQQSKRAWHQPQIESLAVHTSQMLHSIEASGTPGQVLELGAGKGLLAGLLKHKHPTSRVTVLDRREARTGGVGTLEDDATTTTTPDDTTDIRRIHADLQDCDLAAHLGDAAAYPCIVIAKHFCGDATDLAVRFITGCAEGLIHGCVLAPCCHPKTEYANYSGRAFLTEQGFTERDFEALLVLIELSRARSLKAHQTQTASKAFQKKLAGISTLTPEELYSHGRLARRVVEEGRIRALRGSIRGECQVSLCEYAPAGVSPDNLIIKVIRSSGSSPLPPLVPAPAPRLPYSEKGLVLHLVSAQQSDLSMRVAEYLLERRGCGGLRGALGVWVADMRLQREVPEVAPTELVVVHTEGSGAALAAQLRDDPLVCRAVDRMFPFDTVVDGGVSAAVSYIASAALASGEGAKHRVYGYPRQCEQALVAALGADASVADRFHPKSFDSAISVVEWRPCLSEPTRHLVSVVPVAEWDPREWSSVSSSQPPPRSVSRLHEVALRVQGAGSWRGQRVLVLCKGACVAEKPPLEAELRSLGCAVRWEAVQLERGGRCVWAGGQVEEVDCVLLLLDCVKEDAVGALQSLREVVRPGVSVMCPIKICPPSKRNSPAFVKQAHAKVAAALRESMERVQILHLLTDRENERTILGVTAQGTAD